MEQVLAAISTGDAMDVRRGPVCGRRQLVDVLGAEYRPECHGGDRIKIGPPGNGEQLADSAQVQVTVCVI